MTLESVPRYDPDRITERSGQAVVVGASMAGLLTARVLADRFETVVLVDNDPLPDAPVARKGVPQANHAHVMHEAGRATLADLCPGYGEELLSSGALIVDLASDFDFYDEGDFLADGPTRLPMYTATRPLFEGVTRRQVARVDGVTMRGNHGFVDYLVDERGSAVVGVTVRTPDGTSEGIPADLVVDATGRTSRTPRWLDDHGYEAPDADEVHVDLAYSTVLLERPPDDRTATLVMPNPPRKRGAGVFPVENGQWVLTFSGVHGDHPPTDVDGLEAFAGSLPIPVFGRMLAEHRVVSDDVYHYRFPSTVRRRYEDLARFPDGLVVVGDAIASFNPIYGQGMSVAALEALQLHHLLASGREADLPRRFFERVEPVVDDAWNLAVGADFQFAETTGPRPRGTGLLNRYTTRLTRKAHSDGSLADAYVRAVIMERRPTSLFRPKVLWRVLKP